MPTRRFARSGWASEPARAREDGRAGLGRALCRARRSPPPSSTSDTGTPVTISAPPGIERTCASGGDRRPALHISWDDETGTGPDSSPAPRRKPPISPPPSARRRPRPPPGTLAGRHADAEELGAILDTTADGIADVPTPSGNLNSCNRSAEALFGYDGPELLHAQSLPSCSRRGETSAWVHGLSGKQSEGLPACASSARTRPRRAGPRQPRRPDPAVDDDGAGTGADGPEFLRRCSSARPVARRKTSESGLQQARRLADPRRRRPRPTCWPRISPNESAPRSTPSSALPK